MSGDNRNNINQPEAAAQQPQTTEQELSELLQIRRDKLKNLQEEGRDPKCEVNDPGIAMPADTDYVASYRWQAALK